MILRINTTIPDALAVSLFDNQKLLAVKEVAAPRRQAEALLPAIIDLLAEQKISPAELRLIQVVVKGGSFTSLRIGVLTANALAYAWHKDLMAITADGEDLSSYALKEFNDYKIAVPQYEAEPNIGTQSKGTKKV